MHKLLKVVPKGPLAAVLLTGLASSAQAASVTYSDMTALADVEISGVLSVPGFDSSLGTLTGVYWEIEGAIATILGVENDSTGPISGSAYTMVEFDVDSPLLSLGGSPDFDVTASTGLVSLGVGSSAIFPVTATTVFSGMEAGSPAFYTPGTVDVSFLTLTSFGGTGFGGDITISQATDAGIKLTVTYEYEVSEIPLPAAAPLMGAGLAFFSLMSRRRKYQ